MEILETIRSYGIEIEPGKKIKCPFPDHEDSTASFWVPRGKNYFRCFGCCRWGYSNNFRLLIKGECVSLFSDNSYSYTRNKVQDESNYQHKSIYKTILSYIEPYLYHSVTRSIQSISKKYEYWEQLHRLRGYSPVPLITDLPPPLLDNINDILTDYHEEEYLEVLKLIEYTAEVYMKEFPYMMNLFNIDDAYDKLEKIQKEVNVGSDPFSVGPEKLHKNYAVSANSLLFVEDLRVAVYRYRSQILRDKSIQQSILDREITFILTKDPIIPLTGKLLSKSASTKGERESLAKYQCKETLDSLSILVTKEEELKDLLSCITSVVHTIRKIIDILQYQLDALKESRATVKDAGWE